MLQEDSNGESSFEIIDKKSRESSSYNNSDKEKDILETLSNISSPYSMASPSPSVTSTGGNLLSNVAPPTSIPDFTLWPTPAGDNAVTATTTLPISTPPTVFSQPVAAGNPVNVNPVSGPDPVGQLPHTQFSAAIPPSKGILHGPIHQISSSDRAETHGTGFMGLVKEAFSTGGVLSKMAEKARNSVDTIITTLDPQMSEYILSGGDTEITVTTEKEEDVSAIREAVHSVFGKAWVNGIDLKLPGKESVAVGFQEGINNIEERITYSLKFRKTPTIGIENILVQHNDNWYDVILLILKDTTKNVVVRTFSQATPVPVATILRELEGKDEYKSLAVEQKLARYLQTKRGWQQDVSAVTRKEILLLASKTLIKIYQTHF